MIYRLFLILCVFVLPHDAMAGDRFKPQDPSLTIFRQGHPISIYKDDKAELLKRALEVFNSNGADTRQMWLKQKFEQDGVSVAQKWDMAKFQSYFLVTPDAPKPKDKLGRNEVNVQEMLITINELNTGSLFGRVMAKFSDDDIRAYDVDMKTLVNLYCLDKAAKYLPKPYGIFREKYQGDVYEDAGIICSTAKEEKE